MPELAPVTTIVRPDKSMPWSTSSARVRPPSFRFKGNSLSWTRRVSKGTFYRIGIQEGRPLTWHPISCVRVSLVLGLALLATIRGATSTRMDGYYRAGRDGHVRRVALVSPVRAGGVLARGRCRAACSETVRNACASRRLFEVCTPLRTEFRTHLVGPSGSDHSPHGFAAWTSRRVCRRATAPPRHSPA